MERLYWFLQDISDQIDKTYKESLNTPECNNVEIINNIQAELFDMYTKVRLLKEEYRKSVYL